MLMVISPAKTLDYQSPLPVTAYSLPGYLEQARALVSRLQTFDPPQLAELMHLSDRLAALNVARFASWTTPFTPENARPALLAFKGDVYTGIRPEDFSPEELDFAQQHLRILSGLHGVLRPLDLMQPYRLDMGTRLANARGRDLYAFWGQQITASLNQALEDQADPVLINLASAEYWKAVQPRHLRARIVNTEFRDRKNGQYRIISLYAKQARGRMVRHIIRHRLNTPEQLQTFDDAGYYYSPRDSTAERLVFLRD